MSVLIASGIQGMSVLGAFAIGDSVIPADVIRRKAQEVVSRPDYQLDQGLSDESQAMWLTLLTWILKPFFLVFEALNGLPIPLRILVVILLFVALVGLIIHMIWSFAAAVRGTKVDGLTAGKTREQNTDPRQVERMAEQAAIEGRYLEAVRHLFKAALLRIEQSETKKLRIGITNRELLRRYQKTPLLTPLSGLVNIVDRKWYGKELCESADYEACRLQHSDICDVLNRRRHAVSA